MTRYVCEICGYVYVETAGDADNGLSPGTEFNNIPDDWVCPICGVGKDEFTKED